jgi:hypothetical protein
MGRDNLPATSLPSYPQVEVEIVLGSIKSGDYLVEVMDATLGTGRVIELKYAKEEAQAVLDLIEQLEAR